MFRIFAYSRNVISAGVFLGLVLVEIGASWLIGQNHFYGLNGDTSFELMFGALLIAHGLLKRGHPYRIGKIGVGLGALVLAAGLADYFETSDFFWAFLLIALGVIVLVATIFRHGRIPPFF